MPSVDRVERLSGGRVRYQGREFQGFDEPRRSWLESRQRAVLARRGDQFRLLHYGDPNMPDNQSAEQRRRFIARATGIRDSNGRLTKDNIFSANYWALRDLWDYRADRVRGTHGKD